MVGENALSWWISDAAVLSGRCVRHIARNLDGLITAIAMPVTILLLFVWIFGGAIHTGTAYVNYVVPGIILLCAGFGASTTAVSVCADMTGGLVERFRSLPMAPSAVLTGHVVASMVRNLITTGVVVLVALLLGFRPTAGPREWLAAGGVLLLFILAISWLSALLGLLAESAEAANGISFFVVFLPYLSSAFVPTETLPRLLRPVARHQPITPVIETLRGLLLGTPLDNNAWLAVAWCVGIASVSYLGATVVFRRRTRG